MAKKADKKEKVVEESIEEEVIEEVVEEEIAEEIAEDEAVSESGKFRKVMRNGEWILKDADGNVVTEE